MTGHNESSASSLRLCNCLFEMLLAREANLQRRCWRVWCSIEGSGKVFVWIKHGRQANWIEAWFLGNADVIKPASLQIFAVPQCKKTSTRWVNFGGLFKIFAEEDVKEVVQFLLAVSYPRSLGDIPALVNRKLQAESMDHPSTLIRPQPPTLLRE